MGACDAGRLPIIQLLVHRGAEIACLDESDVWVTALSMTRYYPAVVHWLLVDRFTDQGKLGYGGASDTAPVAAGFLEDVKLGWHPECASAAAEGV